MWRLHTPPYLSKNGYLWVSVWNRNITHRDKNTAYFHLYFMAMTAWREMKMLAIKIIHICYFILHLVLICGHAHVNFYRHKMLYNGSQTMNPADFGDPDFFLWPAWDLRLQQTLKNVSMIMKSIIARNSQIVWSIKCQK